MLSARSFLIFATIFIVASILIGVCNRAEADDLEYADYTGWMGNAYPDRSPKQAYIMKVPRGQTLTYIPEITFGKGSPIASTSHGELLALFGAGTECRWVMSMTYPVNPGYGNINYVMTVDNVFWQSGFHYGWQGGGAGQYTLLLDEPEVQIPMLMAGKRLKIRFQ